MQFQSIKDRINQLNEERIAFGDRRHKRERAKHPHRNNTISETQATGPSKSFYFKTNFQGYMEMYCEIDKVGEYLDRHRDWFQNCAKPMIAIPFGDNGYTLNIGRFGSFGYEVEAKINVVMISQGKGRYLMHTVTIPNYQSPGYKVNYKAFLQLSEVNTSSILGGTKNKRLLSQLPDRITKVEWELNLAVGVKFPQFIHKLPCSVIQNTGDRLLTQIVKQVSPLLSYKVQTDFHSRYNLPIPGKNSRNCQKIAKSNLIEIPPAS